MTIPIVLVAFGTTSRAMKTYEAMDARFKECFSEYEIHWAYTSRMVSDRLKHKQNIHRPSVIEVLDSLAESGHPWAVVQSLHLICGHEFYRLVNDAGQHTIRTSMGMPLLYSPQDHEAVINALTPVITAHDDEAVVLVGHGTDHPGWTSYTALGYRLSSIFGPKVHVGVVEQGYPERSTIVRAVIESGYKTVRLVPLMLVAGVHVEEDLAGDDDSWKSAFDEAGIRVELDKEGLGHHSQIVDIFNTHIRDALDMIPH